MSETDDANETTAAPVAVVEVTKEVSGKQAEGFGNMSLIAINIMATLIISACSLMAYDHYMAKKFVSVDVKGFVEEQKSLFLAGKLTDEQLRKNYEALGGIVRSIPKGRIILMGDAVLGGVDKIDLSALTQK